MEPSQHLDLVDQLVRYHLGKPTHCLLITIINNLRFNANTGVVSTIPSKVDGTNSCILLMMYD